MVINDGGDAVKAWWRHPGTQAGVTVALATPFLLYLGAILVMNVSHTHWEYALALNFFFWPYFGILQLVYLLPLAGWSLVTGRRRLCSGLAFGGGILGVLNLVGWALGPR